MALIECKECNNQVSSTAAACPKCGAPVAEASGDTVKKYIEQHSKSYAAGFFLTLLFGPLGLLYANIVAGLIFMVAAFASFGVIGFVGPLIFWGFSILTSFVCVDDFNSKVKANAGLMASKN